LPTGGAPNVASLTGRQRPALLADYEACCKLVQTSDQLDMNGWLMIQPTDIPLQVAHLDMLLANITMCYKAYVGSSTFRQAARDCLEMAAILRGGKESLRRQPAMATAINPTSPLKYSAEEAESIDVDTIKSVGSEGNYLMHPTTFEHCRSLYRPNLFTRDDYRSWWDSGAKNVSVVAAEILPKRLAEYTKPPIDEGLEQALAEFVSRRKKQLFESTSN
jgi:trimethylamine:corrinoid methyltransferase-like protein